MRYRLGEIATVRTGYQFRSAISPDLAGDVLVIQGRDVDSQRGRIDLSESARVRLGGSASLDSHFLKPGEILVMARGGNNAATVIGNGIAPRTVAVASFHVISVKPDKVDPVFLAWQLNETHAQRFFAANMTGSTIQMLGLEVLRRLPLELPPLERQHHIARLIYLIDREHCLLETIAAERQKLLRAYVHQQSAS